LETVQPYAEVAGIAVETDVRLRERDMPAAESREDHIAKVRRSFDDPDFSEPEGESFRDTSNRALLCLRQLVRETPSGLLLVGHGQCMTLLLRHVDARADFDFWAALPTPAIIEFNVDADCQQGSFRELFPVE
jgi:2,3-bisphosphoglycerate-dependent phosphoglycerate mutase